MADETPWHEQDRFWEKMAPVLFTEERQRAVGEDLDRIVDRAQVLPGASILDLGCGPGRYALALARRGYRVTGVDRTAAYLERARAQAGEEGLDVELVQADMRDFRRPETYDVVLSLWSSFGYFEDPAENRRVLKNVHASLKEDGRLLMDMMGKEVLARRFVPRDWQEIDGRLLLEERRVTRDWSWTENRWILIDDGERYESVVSLWIYSAAELTRMLEEGGFASVKVHGGLDGAPYDTQARRLVAVATK
jgi:SAM-dependent methyltransferase